MTLVHLQRQSIAYPLTIMALYVTHCIQHELNYGLNGRLMGLAECHCVRSKSDSSVTAIFGLLFEICSRPFSGVSFFNHLNVDWRVLVPSGQFHFRISPFPWGPKLYSHAVSVSLHSGKGVMSFVPSCMKCDQKWEIEFVCFGWIIARYFGQLSIS